MHPRNPKCQARLEMLAPNAPAYLLAPAEESKKKFYDVATMSLEPRS
jgi:hypothetical protein